MNMISVAEFTNCINKDTSVLAQDGYMQLFALAASCGKLVMLFAFQVYLAVDLGEPVVYPSQEFAGSELGRETAGSESLQIEWHAFVFFCCDTKIHGC